jgi:hypothetical protein
MFNFTSSDVELFNSCSEDICSCWFTTATDGWLDEDDWFSLLTGVSFTDVGLFSVSIPDFLLDEDSLFSFEWPSPFFKWS